MENFLGEKAEGPSKKRGEIEEKVEDLNAAFQFPPQHKRPTETEEEPSAPPQSLFEAPSAAVVTPPSVWATAWLCSDGILQHVNHGGNFIFIGGPGQQFHIHYRLLLNHQEKLMMKCIIDGREIGCYLVSGSNGSIAGFPSNGGYLPFLFAPLLVAANSSEDMIGPFAGRIQLMFYSATFTERSKASVASRSPPSKFLLSSDVAHPKFFNNPGLTVQPGAMVVRPPSSLGHTFQNEQFLCDVVIFYDTDERLRLRGVLPPLVSHESPQKKTHKKAKISEFKTFIDLTLGDEPVISRVKKEPSIVIE